MFKRLLLVCGLFCLAAPAATTIHYQAFNIDDAGAGDLWRYVYSVTGEFNENDAFSIAFDPLLYTDIQDPAPAVADWDILVLQPSTTLPADGIYEPLALTQTTLVNKTFLIDFVWLGPGAPGAQQFQVLSYASATPIVLETGVTIDAAAVPEPASWLLLSGGGAMLALARRRRRRSF